MMILSTVTDLVPWPNAPNAGSMLSDRIKEKFYTTFIKC